MPRRILQQPCLGFGSRPPIRAPPLLHGVGQRQRFSIPRRAILRGIAGLMGTSAVPAHGEGGFSFGVTRSFSTTTCLSYRCCRNICRSNCNGRSCSSSGRTYREISVMLLSGQLDAAWISDFPYLKRGLAGIRNVARAALVTYKGGSETNLLTRSDLDDLSLPVQHETGIRRLHLDWHRISEPLAIDTAGVRQITLNLLLNACAASRFGGIVTVTVSCSKGALRIAVAAEGPGLP